MFPSFKLIFKMKNLTFLFFFAAILGLAFTNPSSSVVSFNVDTTASFVKWTAYKVTGKHFGKVKLQSGSLKMNKTKLVGGTFVVDMTTLAIEDIQGEYADKLKGHLMSDDFFSVEKNKTATFEITKATATDKMGGYKVDGNLTIKGITKPISFTSKITNDGAKVSSTSTIKIDRTNYDIKYGSKKFFESIGDKAIYDEFDLEVTLVANK